MGGVERFEASGRMLEEQTDHLVQQRVAAKYGKPNEAIESFVKKVEISSDYRRLLRRGFISDPVPPGGPVIPKPAGSGGAGHPASEIKSGAPREDA